jgi:hypothetical protein
MVTTYTQSAMGGYKRTLNPMLGLKTWFPCLFTHFLSYSLHNKHTNFSDDKGQWK